MHGLVVKEGVSCRAHALRDMLQKTVPKCIGLGRVLGGKARILIERLARGGSRRVQLKSNLSTFTL